jgi:hypothetical protein
MLISDEKSSIHPTITTAGYQHKTFKINLPKCHQHIIIEQVLETLVSNNGKIDRTWMMHVVIGGQALRINWPVDNFTVVFGGQSLPLIIIINDSLNRREEMNVELQPAIILVQQELGKTSVPISVDFFIRFCYLLQSRCFQGVNVTFKESTRNSKPTLQSIKPWLMEQAIQDISVSNCKRKF